MTRHQPVLPFTNRERERELFRFSWTKKRGNVITRYSIWLEIIQFRISVCTGPFNVSSIKTTLQWGKL